MIDTNPTRLQSALATLLVLCLLPLSSSAQTLEDQIRERLTPAGEVCVMGEDCAAGLAMSGGGGGESMAPEQIYQTYCFACHGTGVNNSPVLGDAEAWAPRIEKGIDVLYENAINGFNNNAMPAMGLCMECSEDDIRATVDYMLDEVQ